MKLSTIAITFTTILTTFAQYESKCEENETYCQATCDKEGGVKNHVCNSQNLIFDCVCNNGVRPAEAFGNFPARIEACTVQRNKCREDCNDDAACLAACDTEKCLFKDINDGNTTKPVSTTASADKSKASSKASDPPKLNGGNVLANAPTYTFVAGTLFALSLYL